MGRFVNPDNSAFQVALNSKIYVDKTGLIEYTNSVLDTTDAYICNSRPRSSESRMQRICWQRTTVRVRVLRRCFLDCKLVRKQISGSISISMM